jgi:phthalate 4,5-dioxygenase
MLTQEDNDLLTRTGRGTPMGELMRRYWIPALPGARIAEPDGPPVRVKLLGERLVAFRDTQGRVGLIDERCPHRTASMFYGRNEECGLRCVYHGWKFDVDGKCVDLPGEPANSRVQSRMFIKAYPCLERGGLVWTYMGPPEFKPAFPDLEWTTVPDSYRYVSRHMQDCNWLQGFEGGFDTSHLSFLHRGTVDHIVPTRYEVMPTDFGFVAGTARPAGENALAWTASVMLMPFHKIIPTMPLGGHAWVPMDDENTMLYSIDYRTDRPLNDEELAAPQSGHDIHTINIPGTDRAIANKDNEYLIDRALQASGASYSGMKGLGIQDCAIQESMGPIADRTLEHLVVGDTAIVKIRRLLLQTLKDMEAGRPLPGTDVRAYRVRSARFRTAADVVFHQEIGRHISADTPIAAK